MNLCRCAILSVTLVLLAGFASAQDEAKRAANQANDNLQQRLDSFEKKLGSLFDHTGKDVTMLKRSFDEMKTELQVLRDDLERLRKEGTLTRDEVRAQLQRESERLKEQRRQLQNERADQEAKAKQARAPALQPVSLRHSKADDVVKLVRELLQDDAKRIRLAADLRTNTVLIYANREDTELVRSILQHVDRDDGMQ